MRVVGKLPLIFGLTFTFLLLLFTFGSAAEAHYPKHDFLDHIVTLTAAWRPDAALDFSYQIPHVLASSVPLTALGFSPFSIPDLLFSPFSVEVGWALSQLIGRTVGFALMYATLLAFVGESKRTKSIQWAATSAATAFALMPYWPNLVWTLNALVLALLGARLLEISKKPKLGRLLLVISPHLAFFAWGGFLIPLLFTSFVAWTYVWRKARTDALVDTVLLVLSSLLSASGLIFLQANNAFVSHRAEWAPLPLTEWFAQDAISEASGTFPLVFLTGLYHFGTLFSSAISPVPGWLNVLFTFVLIVMSIIVGHSWGRAERDEVTRDDQSWLPTIIKIVKLMALQGSLALIWALEISRATDFKSILGIPFQIGRIIAISPIIWAFLLFFLLGIAFSRLGGGRLNALGLAILFAISAQGIWMNPSIASRFDLLSHNHLLVGQVSTIPEYFMEEQMSRARELMEMQSPNPRVVSLGISPMIAPYNGIESLDGYVFNYPLEHKELFVSVLQPSTRGILQEEFELMSWGSRLQLNPSTAILGMADFDLCSLSKSGVTHVLSSYSLAIEPAIALQGIFGETRVYKLNSLALCQ